MLEVREAGGCFVCGSNNSIGLKAQIRSNPQQRSAECSIAVPRHFQGWEDIVHGGILATLLDEICIYAGRTIAANLVTAELSLRYRKPVPVETELMIRAVVTAERKRVLEVRGSIEINGETYAEATAQVFIVKPI